MDSLFTPKSAAKLDPRFELRTVTGGCAVVVSKEEKWAPAASLPHSASSSAAAGGAAAGTSSSSSATSTVESRKYTPSSYSLEKRYELCRSVGEECIQDEELRALLKVKPHPVCYDGFEPSGRMHIAQGILKSILVNRLTSAGCIFKFYVADWFAL